MTIDDRTEVHRIRCQPHLLALRMLARGEAATGYPRQAVTETIQATEAVLAEAEAAGRAARDSAGDVRGSQQSGTFLRVRLNRLAAAADDVIAAVTAGDPAQMRRQLSRFEALTSAIWAVQDAVYRPAGAPRQRRAPSPRQSPAAG